MSLTPGTRLGPYDVLAAIGAGGMGEVYRARDTKLDRDVALKILPETFTNDAERLARFQREAKVLASLNHPNIAAIYGLEDADDTRALVLELVDGPTLADRIAEGPIPVDEALPIAKQIAEALEAAHEAGIIHRDLKPANIKLRPDGTVKVLDFGLAKALEGEQAQADQANSPTLTAAASQMGMIMGTAAYMSPEQARGKPVDKRADIWAFGVVLYEMLTGQRAFEADDVSHTLAFVLTKEVDWSALPVDTPASWRRLLRRCFDRNPNQRLRDIGEARVLFDERSLPEALRPVPAANVPWRPPVPLAVAASLIACVATGVGVWLLMRSEPTVIRTSISLPEGVRLVGRPSAPLAVSPDGSLMVYAGQTGTSSSRLYLRPLDQVVATPISDTEGGHTPFFSPDGQWLAFFTNNALKKVALTGGGSLTISEATPDSRGGSWGPDDTIVFAPTQSSPLMRVSAGGGTPEPVTTLETEGEQGHRWPQFLPDGSGVLFTIRTTTAWSVGLLSLDSMEIQVLRSLGEGVGAQYSPTGHLTYVQDGALLAVPFDLGRHQLMGTAVSLVDGIRTAAIGVPYLALSHTGLLVYVAGSAGGFMNRTLVWVDREGREQAIAAEPGPYGSVRLSPDGTRAILDLRDQEDDIWVWNLGRETLTRLTFGPAEDRDAVWTSDGQKIVFSSEGDDGWANLYWKNADGTGEQERLTHGLTDHTPNGLSPDGRFLVIREASPGSGDDLELLSLDTERSVQALLVTEFDESDGVISPDGRWLAYQSDASGQDEVYARPFPNIDEGHWLVSRGGGRNPLWSPDGQELFYRTDAGGVMAVPIESDGTFSPGNPAMMFEGLYPVGFNRAYDIDPDGQRFLMIREGAGKDVQAAPHFVVVQGWFEELKARVPTGR